MPTILKFNMQASPATMERQLQRAHKLFPQGECVPEGIWNAANALLAEEARQLAFSTRRSYMECQKEVLKRKPHLRLGVTGFRLDKYFPGVEFTQEDDRHADT